MENEKEILSDAVELYGADAQITVAIEEMSELTKELCKAKRGKANIDNIAEEIADVEIMVEQLKIIFDCTNKIEQSRRFKIDRLVKRMLETTRKRGGNE